MVVVTGVPVPPVLSAHRKSPIGFGSGAVAGLTHVALAPDTDSVQFEFPATEKVIGCDGVTPVVRSFAVGAKASAVADAVTLMIRPLMVRVVVFGVLMVRVQLLFNPFAEHDCARTAIGASDNR
jgi:hypothetical protein